MTRDHADQWKAMISEDLMHARRCLVMHVGGTDSFLRHRIAEDEAILERLAAMERAASSNEAWTVGCRPS